MFIHCHIEAISGDAREFLRSVLQQLQQKVRNGVSEVAEGYWVG